ncbi:outer dense fiber protein 3-like [Dendronephthya gigantea]|uniref:outer dense fiber protein 3-like n=1 Tax=Dendronephthya gigantea TaxID=151771 RepID=UPI00106D83E4|nr:outer dense fiber protein 3-like [Dendronephthya gigantea]
MGNRRRNVTNEYPGPNHYNITIPCKPNARKAPEFSMGQAKKEVSDSSGPGPAAYCPKVKKTDQGYSMSSRPRPLKTIKPTPAPNAYKICKGQTSKGVNNGCSASLKSRASPYVYSGFPNLTRITT